MAVTDSSMEPNNFSENSGEDATRDEAAVLNQSEDESSVDTTDSRVENLEVVVKSLEVQLARLTVRLEDSEVAPPTPPPPEPIYQKPIISGLNPQYWTGFQLAPKKDPVYSFDILVGEPKIHSGRARRQKDGNTLALVLEDSEDEQMSRSLNTEWGAQGQSFDAEKELQVIKGTIMPERIRLGSFTIQYLVRNILKCGASIPHGCSNRGIIMLRPFKPLFLELGQDADFEVQLKRLIDQIGDFEQQRAQSKIKNHDGDIAPSQDDPTPEEDGVTMGQDDLHGILRRTNLLCCDDCTEMLLRDIPTTSKAQDIMRGFLTFFIDYLKPIHEQHRRRLEKQIRFCDLWHLFKPGDELVFRRKAVVSANHQKDHADFVRVLRVSGGRRNVRLLPPPPPPPPFPEKPGKSLPVANIPYPRSIGGFVQFTIDAYYFDYDGIGLEPQRIRVFIDPYPGKRDITDLLVHPSEYIKDDGLWKSTCASYGRSFIAYINAQEATHRECRGRELEENNELNEQVVVDMKECWKEDGLTRTVVYVGPPSADSSETNACPHCAWFDQTCSHGISRNFPDEYVDQEQMSNHTEEQMIFQHRLKVVSTRVDMTNDDLAICTHRVYAYSLPSKSWVRVHVKDLHEVKIRGKDTGFDLLVIPSDHKKFLISQVQEHFRRKTQLNLNPDRSVDLVRGKGQGLIILLHGAPGVGKTATAECMADLMRRPLYSITCGDLGSNAQEIEQELRYHLRLASQWDCILLLDEADVFLAKRNGQDHERNAIVSVFLRTLEYYKGVLFLTTNRVGSFDEAFTSRIHISLFYENFDRETTLEVWETFIRQTQRNHEGTNFQMDTTGIRDFARKHYDSHRKESRWNGRQIRNAFSTAIAMSEFQARIKKMKTDTIDPLEYANIDDVKVKLGSRQFEKISRTVEEFNEYMEKTTGASFEAKMEKEKMRKSNYKRKDSKKDRDEDDFKKSSKRSKSKYRDSSDSSESSEMSDSRNRKHGRSRSKAEKKKNQRSTSESDSDSP